MRALRRFFSRVAGVLMGGRREADLRDEMQSHIEMQTEDNLRAGMTPGEARRQARLKFGDVELAKEEYRDGRGLPALETFIRDVRYGLRVLAKSPGFTAVAVLTLALGIGANTAIFSVVNAVLLRPLPYRDPGSLVAISQEIQDFKPLGGIRSVPVNFLRLRDQTDTLKDMSGLSWAVFRLVGVEEPEELYAGEVTANFFSLLGWDPLLGAGFTEAQESSKAKVVVLTYGVWQRQFGGDPGIVGRSIKLDDRGDGDPEPMLFTVVGVMPADFWFHRTGNVKIWTLMSRRRNFTMELGSPSYVVGRLPQDTTLEQVYAELKVHQEQVLSSQEKERLGRELIVRSLREEFVAGSRSGLLLLAGAVGFVLLIACANLANLLLSRGLNRQHELAVRATVGASRGRLFGQMMTESTLLALVGGAVGVAVGYAGKELLLAITYQRIPRLETVAVDPAVMGFTFLLAVVSAVLFGVMPALRSSQISFHGPLRMRGGARQQQTIRNVLVVAEIALSLVLTVGAGLMVNTFAKLKSVDLGFQPDQLLVVGVSQPGFKEHSRRVTFFDELEARLEAVPGIRSASLMNYEPVTSIYFTMKAEIPGVVREAADPVRFNVRVVGPNYFETVGIPVLRGRPFDRRDRSGAQRVVIIDETTAQRYWPESDPMGEEFLLRSGREEMQVQVVGLVKTIAQAGLKQERQPQIYLPYMQYSRGMSQAILRTEAEPYAVVSAVKAAVRSIQKDLPVGRINTINENIDRELAEPTFFVALLSSFALLGLLLAAIGLYGVMAHAVRRRTQEIGVRMAMGAQRAQVMGMVLKEGLILVSAGILLGLAGAVGVTRLLESQLFETTPTDSLSFALSAVFLGMVGLLACYLPARHATRVDPMTALRHE